MNGFMDQKRDVPFTKKKKTPFHRRRASSFTRLGRYPRSNPHMDYLFKWSPLEIARQRKIIRILGILITVLCFVSFILPLKWMLFTLLSIPLFYYCLYIWLFPKMIMTDAKGCDEYHIPFPMLSCAIPLLILLNFINRINMPMRTWMMFSLASTIILLIPYLIMLCIKRIKEHPAKLFLTACIFFIISLATCHAINYITVFDSPKHDFVIVTKKYDNHAPKSGTNYYFQFIWHGDEQNMGADKSLYESTEVGDVIKVCSRKSIFGVEFQLLHK